MFKYLYQLAIRDRRLFSVSACLLPRFASTQFTYPGQMDGLMS